MRDIDLIFRSNEHLNKAAVLIREQTVALELRDLSNDYRGWIPFIFRQVVQLWKARYHVKRANRLTTKYTKLKQRS